MPAQTNTHLIGTIPFLVLAPLLWAGNFVVGRAMHETIDPFSLNYLRWVIAGVIMLPVIFLNRRSVMAALRAHLLQLVALSVLGIVLFNWLLYIGLQYTPSSIAGLVIGLTPLIILIVSRFWSGRRLGLWEVAGTVMAFVGVAIVLFQPSDMSGIKNFLFGPGAVFAAGFAWAFYTVGLKRFAVPLPSLTYLAVLVWCGVFVMTPVALLGGWAPLARGFERDVLAAVLYLGLGASVLAFFFWQLGVARLGPARSAIFLQLIPFFSVMLGAIFLGEQLSPSKLLGLTIVILGVVLAQRKAALNEA